MCSSAKRPSVLLVVAASLAIALAAAPQIHAIEKYTGNVVGECHVYAGKLYTVRATIGSGSPNWFVSGLTYSFNPAPKQAPSFVDEPDGKTRHLEAPPGDYTVTVTNPELQGQYAVKVPVCRPKGLTWTLIAPPSPAGTIRVGCNNGCDAYKGDKPCSSALPLLCIKKSGPGLPFPKPASVNDTSQYNRWSGGVVGTTGPIVPPATLAAADALCVQEFGAGWRVAEFHDGWGWAFQAYGGIGDPSKRFWIHINDQPAATCWH